MNHPHTVIGGFSALEQIAAGVILLDEQSNVLYLNATAARILADNDGIGIRDNRLVAMDSAGRPLRDALARSQGVAVCVPRPSGAAGYIVVVIPGRTPQGAVGAVPSAKAVFITDPAARPRTREDLLRQIWRLTPAEARVAIGLFDGLTPGEIAACGKVSEATVRTQLRAIFAKAGVHRQAELIRLFGSIPGLQVSDDA